jgi:hypothetical protein
LAGAQAGDVSTPARSKRLHDVSELADGPTRRPGLRLLSASERRELLSRVGRYLPLLVGTGRLWVGRDGEVCIIERHVRGAFVAGYVYPRGSVREATIVLPVGARVVFLAIDAEAAA